MSDRTRQPSDIRDGIRDLGYDRFVEVAETVDSLTDVADAILALVGRVLARDYPQDAAGSVAREVARTLSEAGLLADSYDRLLLAVAAAARKAKAETVEVIHEHRDGSRTRERVPASEVDALLVSHNHEAFEAGTVETWVATECR